MKTLLEAHVPSDPKWSVIDGRHRLVAAAAREIPSLRCDVLTRDGGHAMRVLPIHQLQVDLDVQLDFAYDDRRARRLLDNWDDQRVGILTTIPISDQMSVRDKASIKTGLDRDRRRVYRVESFLEDLKAEESEATTITEAAERKGWEIGKIRKGQPANRIEAVGALCKILRGSSEQILDRTFAMMTQWGGDPKSTTGLWIETLFLLTRDHYDEDFTPATWKRLTDVVPATIIRRAIGETQVAGSGGGQGINPAAYHGAVQLRKRGRLKIRPPVGKWASLK